jgi:hypothetical protein
VSRLRRPGGTLGAEKVRGRRATYRRVCRLFRNRRRRCHPRGGFASAGARTRACLCVDWGGGKWSAVSPVPRGNRAIEKAN